MALEENNGNGLQATLPLAPAGYSGGYGYPMMGFPMMGGFGGFGNGFGGDWSWILLLLLICNGGWGGFGGFGGFGGGLGIDFPWLLNGQQGINANTNAGFNQAATANSLNGLSSAVASGVGDIQLGIAGVNQNICQTGNAVTNAINSGFGDVQTALCGGFAGVNANISNTAAQSEIAANGRHSALTNQLFNNEINSLNRSFAEQTANTAAINGVSSQLAKCCCDQELATVGLQNVIQTENAADRAALSDGIRDVLTATQAQNQRILDKLCDQELQAERRENAELRSRLNMADLAASQAAQTAALVADNTAQTQYIVNRVSPYPVPAFPVGNPYGYNYGGWNNGYGNNWGGPNPFGNVGFGNGSF